MAGQKYERLTIEKFGRELITSGDLDPVYIALTDMDLGPEQKCRWLLAYWCWYHCGVASWLSEFEGPDFWVKMLQVAKNEKEHPMTGTRYQRGKERRHARGDAGINMVMELMGPYHRRPERFVEKACLLAEFRTRGHRT